MNELKNVGTVNATLNLQNESKENKREKTVCFYLNKLKAKSCDRD